jgi:hypothetical protein
MASTVRCSSVLLPTLSRHFGQWSVSGRNRLAIPAAKITPIMYVLLLFVSEIVGKVNHFVRKGQIFP